MVLALILAPKIMPAFFSVALVLEIIRMMLGKLTMLLLLATGWAWVPLVCVVTDQLMTWLPGDDPRVYVFQQVPVIFGYAILGRDVNSLGVSPQIWARTTLAILNDGWKFQIGLVRIKLQYVVTDYAMGILSTWFILYRDSCAKHGLMAFIQGKFFYHIQLL